MLYLCVHHAEVLIGPLPTHALDASAVVSSTSVANQQTVFTGVSHYTLKVSHNTFKIRKAAA